MSSRCIELANSGVPCNLIEVFQIWRHLVTLCHRQRPKWSFVLCRRTSKYLALTACITAVGGDWCSKKDWRYSMVVNRLTEKPQDSNIFDDMYSLAQKHCTKFSNDKSMVFSPVNILENLHASTYMASTITDMKSKKMPRMATLTYSHFGNPGRSYHRAHYSTSMCIKARKHDERSTLSLSHTSRWMYRARKCHFDQLRRAAAGGRPLVVAFFSTLYM